MSSDTGILVMALSLVALPVPSQGKVLLTPQEALELAFPECEIERKTHFLDDEQQDRVAEMAGKSFRS